MSVEDEEISVPNYGWKVQLNHRFPEAWNQSLYPRLNQLSEFIRPAIRYLKFHLKMKSEGRKPFINNLKMIHGKQMYGVPLGGIGSGTIGRGFRGEFCRYQMSPGIYEYNTVLANQFIVNISNESGKTLYQRVLCPGYDDKKKTCLQSWDWTFNASDSSYCGLYPRSWTIYNIKEQNIKLICRQVSPVIPNDYKDSCLPVAVFIWSVENFNPEPRNVSITFSFKNGTGGKSDTMGGCWTEAKTSESSANVVLSQTLQGLNLRYCIGVKKSELVNSSYLLSFNPKGSGNDLWDNLKENGCLNSEGNLSERTLKGQELGMAVCGQCLVESNSKSTIEMGLSWDMPKLMFKARGQAHYRRYTRWFGGETGCQDILDYAFLNYSSWESKIYRWQNPVLSNPNLPDWFKSALFNELYFISDGGSLWLETNKNIPPNHKNSPADNREEYGRFAYLEAHEYRMYNTYDVHFYASWALLMLWPELQKSLQFDFLEYTALSNESRRSYLYDGKKGPVNLENSVPHDLGDPEDEPFVRVNAYVFHDTNEWKDLNLKFVLQVYRDFKILQDRAYLDHMWPMLRAVMNRAFTFDRDDDGLIENNGKCDQTYDTWSMHGPSAYCCSLWLASLAAMVDLAKILEDDVEESRYVKCLIKARNAMQEKLWTGSYYKFDSCGRSHSTTIMSDQLVGQWYLSLIGSHVEAYEKANVLKALKTIYEKNVKCFENGKMGAVNGMKTDGVVDVFTIQSEEVWTGTTYALASLMISEGMESEGFSTAEGIYRTVYEKIGQGFETPEALFAKKKYRAVGYMRPLAIWSMYYAYCNNQNKKMSV